MDYPRRIIELGETDVAVVRAVKERLNEALGLTPDDELYLEPDNPSFGPRTRRIVKLFQARNVDPEGAPLKQDGEIGSLTWAALFGTETIPSAPRAEDAFLTRVLEIAAREEAKGVREQPKNSNRGPEVNAYLRSTDTPPGHAWSCAFVYWCFEQAAKQNGRSNPMVRTANCLDHWNRSRKTGAHLVTREAALADPHLVRPGMIFVVDHGRGAAHTGLVEKVTGSLITTIEGDADASRTREGGGVYRVHRKISEINKGFVDYSR
jgi:hypothetical protein